MQAKTGIIFSSILMVTGVCRKLQRSVFFREAGCGCGVWAGKRGHSRLETEGPFANYSWAFAWARPRLCRRHQARGNAVEWPSSFLSTRKETLQKHRHTKKKKRRKLIDFCAVASNISYFAKHPRRPLCSAPFGERETPGDRRTSGARGIRKRKRNRPAPGSPLPLPKLSPSAMLWGGSLMHAYFQLHFIIFFFWDRRQTHTKPPDTKRGHWHEL